MPQRAKTSKPVPSKKLLPDKRQRAVTGVLLLLLLAVGLRVWHDRGPASASGTAASADLEREAHAHPQDLKAQLDWGEQLQKNGRLQEAEQVFSNAMQLAPQDARAPVWLGILAVQANRPEAAIGYFLEGTRRNPNDADVWHTLAELYQKQGEDPKAVAAYERVTQLQPKNELCWRQLGVLDVHLNLQARGHEALQTAAKLDPNDIKAQSALGSLTLAMGLLPEAKQAFDVVLAHQPDDPTALAGMAKVCLQLDASTAGLEKASTLIDRAISQQPSATAYLIRGQIHLLRKEYAAAIADLNTALKTDPGQLAAYGYLSQAYAASGQPDKARKATADYATARLHAKQSAMRSTAH